MVGLRDVLVWWADQEMFWADGQIRRRFGLVGRSGDVLGRWTDQEMFWAGGQIRRCFRLVDIPRDVLDW